MAKKRKAGATTQKEVAYRSLPWSAVSLPSEATAGAGETDADFHQGFSYDDDDYMGLTEVDNVEVVRGKDGIVKFVVGKQAQAPSVSLSKGKEKAAVKSKKARKDSEVKGEADAGSSSDLPFAFGEEVDGGEERQEEEGDEELGSMTNFALLERNIPDEGANGSTTATANKLPAWKKLRVPLNDLLYQALYKSNFNDPTAIQSAALPYAVPKDSSTPARDVVGVAQTGSGKTLAYGLPILNWIAGHSPEDRLMDIMEEASMKEDQHSTRLAALILTPTRELAIQVAKSLSDMIDAASTDKSRRWASVATLTGGMNEEKQRRTLQGYGGRGVDIVVATPGRLWDICKGDDLFVQRIKLTRFLVVDEADRMIEAGHFAELENIFALVRRHDQANGHGQSIAKVHGGAGDMQTFIYSATMSKELQRNFHRRQSRANARKAGQSTTLEELLQAIDFRDPEPAVVDLSTSTRLADNVHECKVECLQKEKDLYLYYFLLRFPGRTLVFVNAIDGIRRLQPLLENLQIAVQPLHSQLQQKQRLKNMDRFRTNKVAAANGVSSVLLATDVAARGLDIPDVDHVVHFQVPRTADSYVHRSGRTGRAGNAGVAVTLIEPSEKRVWLALCKSLGRQDSTVASLPIEYDFLPALKQRIEIAGQIDKAMHTQKKEAHDDAWLRKLAQEAEMDLSDEEGGGKADGVETKGKRINANVAALRARLQAMLKTPLRARGLSFKYITGGNSRHFLDSLLGDRQHDQMMGAERSGLLGKVGASKGVKKGQDGKGAVSTGKRKRAG